MASAPAHAHGHGHDHGLGGDWQAWKTDRTLRVVVIVVALAAITTVVGIIGLWPDGEGRRTAIANAEELGLVTDRVAGTVESVLDQTCSYSTDANPQECRIMTFEVSEGPEAGRIVELPEVNLTFDRTVPDLGVGDRVILGYEDSTDFYFYADRDRRSTLVWLAGLFAVVVVALGRWRGLLALAGMAVTLVVLISFVAPSVLDGNDPLLVAVVAASAIAFVSLYLTHGFSPTTTVALAGTLAALGLTLGLSSAFFALADFTGLATEEALLLPFLAEELDVSSVLLGGAVIGALGALDDVTVTQVATVAEVKRRNPTLGTRELVTSGIRVGREHIASTVNTLLLAYAGASMPLLLLFAVSDQPLEMVANSELIAVEIVRTLCGSVGLVAAVPITTTLAALVIAGPREPRTPGAPTAAPEPEQGGPEPHVDAEAAEPAPRWEDFGPSDGLDV